MIHLRIIAPEHQAHQALDLLCESDSVVNVVHIHGASQKPEGDLILCDVAREDASVIIGDLKELEVHKHGSIAVEELDSAISERFDEAERSAKGMPSDAVVWEEVESRTEENTELSVNFVAFMVLAMQIAVVGIVLDQPILIVGAMVVGPEFGPLAGLSVAAVRLERDLAKRSLAALAVGFPVGIAAALLTTVLFIALGLFPDGFSKQDHPSTDFISSPGLLGLFVAMVAGSAGVLSLTSAKSGALIGVAISVTTIPAAANIGLAAAYGNGDLAAGAAEQLGINLSGIVASGVLTLFVQRRLYVARRKRHLAGPARAKAGLPEKREA